MVAIYVAYTQQINPAGATPVLTRAQIWAGLERKVRRAQDFVPVITECKLLEDKGDVVIREAKFVAGQDGVPGREGKTPAWTVRGSRVLAAWDGPRRWGR